MYTNRENVQRTPAGQLAQSGQSAGNSQVKKVKGRGWSSNVEWICRKVDKSGENGIENIAAEEEE